MSNNIPSDMSELRPALYHRFHAFLPFLFHPLARRFWRVVGWLLVLAYFVFAGLILTLRYAVLPNIENYRHDISQMMSQALDLPVEIGSINAGWAGLNPDLSLLDVSVADSDGRQALAFSRVEVVLDWSSLWRPGLRLSLLAIDEPVLHIRRDPQGKLFVAGIPLSEGGDDTDSVDWILGLKRIRINGATLVWEDQLRGAKPLILEDVNLAVDNDGDHHRFGLTALPPDALASRIDIRGNLTGEDLTALDAWEGQLFAELDYIDLSGWRPWIDYPFALPEGKGGMRLWLSVAEGSLFDLTADLALNDVHLQLTKNLPELQLASFDGRVSGKKHGGGFTATGKKINLVLQDGTRTQPIDFNVNWEALADGKSVKGSATASRLNLQRITHLAAYLPLDTGSRKLLDGYAPTGEISDLRLTFSGNPDQLDKYSVRARFDSMGLRAESYFPGFSGISGSVEASESGGSITIRSKASGLDLPSVFPEPHMSFDTLNVQARWKIAGKVIDVDLSKAEFSGKDAAGTAKGTYRFTGEGPGVIDLTAALSRARGTSIWRYLPHTVGIDGRDWVRQSITAGSASDAKLTLKGDLSRFPFLDGSGTFLVKAKAHDVTIDYAKGWPRVDSIEGDLTFAGAGMRVDARSGRMLGTRISQTVAEIDDFDAIIPRLTVKGRVDGPTSRFLEFIEASPVGASIDHATSEMKAVGDGRLDLSLLIPLGNTDDSKVSGDFEFLGNEVTVEPALPPLTGVKGELKITDSAISIREINGQFLGGPVKISAATREGRVEVLATGALSVAEARRHYDLRLFDYLSGSANWRTEVKVKKNSADIVVESNLSGLVSSLPAPFAKVASEKIPVRVVKGIVIPEGAADKGKRDRIDFRLGKLASGQLFRRFNAEGKLLPERGGLAVGAPLVLPDKGMQVTLVAPRVDIDFWELALQPKTQTTALASKQGGAAAFMPSRVDLRTDVLNIFGREFNAVNLQANAERDTWKMTMASREANGDVQYETAGRGALRARLKNYIMQTPPRSEVKTIEPAPTLENLPALDVTVEDFSLGKNKLGRLEVVALNESANWRIQKLIIDNADGRLDGTGAWRMTEPRQFGLDFSLASENVGGLLDRLGYVDSVKRGKAKLAGKLVWAGVPAIIDYPSLTGEMTLDASNGQFSKIDPGAAGKLLGLISLQGLPRRISLDFQDVFSEGFAFDSITSKMDVKAGIMRTDRLQIDGPSARVLMRGEVDLQNETQKLMVNIQPELGGTTALGVALINPIAGAATLLAQKFLQNPLGQAFSFDYSITGKWDDPKMEKVSGKKLDALKNGGGEMREGK